MKLTSSLLLVLAASLADAISLSRDAAVGPKRPFNPLPPTHARTRVCNVPSHSDGSDDSEYILSALKECNNGGKVVFDKRYVIGTALDLRFLKHVDLGREKIIAIDLLRYILPIPSSF